MTVLARGGARPTLNIMSVTITAKILAERWQRNLRWVESVLTYMYHVTYHDKNDNDDNDDDDCNRDMDLTCT